VKTDASTAGNIIQHLLERGGTLPAVGLRRSNRLGDRRIDVVGPEPECLHGGQRIEIEVVRLPKGDVHRVVSGFLAAGGEPLPGGDGLLLGGQSVGRDEAGLDADSGGEAPVDLAVGQVLATDREVPPPLRGFGGAGQPARPGSR
jgi:hypothetical protein